jgi:polysaccharide export outer membrane protein
MINKYSYFFLLLILVVSCKTKEKASEINYLQNIESIAEQTALNKQTSTLQNGDQLVILITAKDMDVVKPFNQNYSSSEVVQNSMPAAGNVPYSGNASIAGPTYILDSEGNIDFPVLGNLHVAGKTLVEFKDELRNRMSKYIINPTINIKLINFKISVMGEVSRPGEYTIVEGQGTIWKALSLAGDLTIYGKRDDVLIVRTENGQITKSFINLKDATLIDSPYYYLKQGDVIFVSANKNREVTANTNPNTGLYISIASVAVCALAIVLSVFKK